MDLTGTYTPEGFWEFQPYPKLKPAAQALFDRVRAGAAAGRTVNDVTGDCWPPGMPIIMTRVWPFHVIALKTAIVMVFNFQSQARWIYLDGREHSRPEYLRAELQRRIDRPLGGRHARRRHAQLRDAPALHRPARAAQRPTSASSSAIRSIEGGDRLSIEYTMTDPENWEGDWVVTKTFKRQERMDFVESPCLPNTNEGLPAMQKEYTDRLGDEAQ